jgi:hypothetical protein
MRPWTAIVAAALLLLTCAGPTQAQTAPKTAGDLAKKCISDNRSLCASFIVDAIGALDSARQTRGEASCLAGDAAQDEIVRTFTRALLAKYAYSDLTASAAVEAIYQDNCAHQN